jgi:hypothetical protein
MTNDTIDELLRNIAIGFLLAGALHLLFGAG